MNTKNILTGIVGLVMFIMLGGNVGAQKITVKIIADAAPKEVLLTLCTGEEIVLDKLAQGEELLFTTKIAPQFALGVECQCTLIAECMNPNLTEVLYLRLPTSARSKDLKFRIYHVSTISTHSKRIEELELQGADLLSSYKTYFEARRMYREMYPMNPQHTVTIRAARLWFDAAYRLAASELAKNSYIAMDEDAVKANQKLAQLAPKAFGKITSPDYLASMTAHAMSIGWTEIRAIPELISDGNWEAATQINRFYLDSYQNLSVAEQSKIKEWYKIDLPLLENNMQYIQSYQLTSHP